MSSGNRKNDESRRIEINQPVISRRGLLKGAGAMGLAASASFWIPAPAQARWKPAAAENLRRWSGLNPALIKLAENYSSPWLLGPRMSDELVELIDHMYSDEEAQLLQYLTPWSSKTADRLARDCKRPVSEVKAILDQVTSFQRSLLTFGQDKDEMKYNLYPLLPGAFELVLVKPDETYYTDWHYEVARRFSRLYNTGDFAVYWDKSYELVRYIPVYSTIRNNPSALPSDQLPAILERYQDIAVGLCQCTTTAKAVDQYCGRPHFTCMTMGVQAQGAIKSGVMRRVELKEALEIKMQAEEAGLSTWMMNMDDETFKGNVSCSCCGCCCLALRALNQFNKPGLLARPHFMPRIDQELCQHCELCMDRCNMGAHQVTEDTHTFDPLRCIGCGLCASTCPAHALTMEPVKNYKPPFRSNAQILVNAGPKIISSINKERWRRIKERG